MRRVAVPFGAFAERIHDTGLSFRRLIRNIAAELSRRKATSACAPEELERIQTIGEVLPGEGDFESLDKLGSRLRSPATTSRQAAEGGECATQLRAAAGASLAALEGVACGLTS